MAAFFRKAPMRIANVPTFIINFNRFLKKRSYEKVFFINATSGFRTGL